MVVVDDTLYKDREEELWTPLDDYWKAYMESLHDEYGSWTRVAVATGCKLRQITYLRKGHIAGRQIKSVSMTTVKTIVDGTGVGSLRQFRWYTPAEMMRFGHWKAITATEVPAVKSRYRKRYLPR